MIFAKNFRKSRNRSDFRVISQTPFKYLVPKKLFQCVPLKIWGKVVKQESAWHTSVEEPITGLFSRKHFAQS